MTFAGQDGARLGGEVFHAKDLMLAITAAPSRNTVINRVSVWHDYLLCWRCWLLFLSQETTKSIAFPERPCFADLDKGRSQHFSGVVV